MARNSGSLRLYEQEQVTRTPPGFKQLKGPAVDLPIAFDGRVPVPAALGKGRRVQGDKIEAPAGHHRLLQEGEDVGLHQLQVVVAVEAGVFPGQAQGRLRALHQGDPVGPGRQVHGKAALIGEGVQDFPPG